MRRPPAPLLPLACSAHPNISFPQAAERTLHVCLPQQRDPVGPAAQMMRDHRPHEASKPWLRRGLAWGNACALHWLLAMPFVAVVYVLLRVP